MKVQKIESKENIKMIISDTTASFANTLRRACSFEVPVLAIEDVYFTKNNSALYDEIIAHRMGLIPLKTDLKTYENQESCKCKGAGCARCQVKLTLDIKGPTKVYAKDLKSTDPQVKPIYPNMLIVELLEGQEIQFEAVAILGTGKVHAKWSAGHSYYQRYPKISIGSGAKVKEGIAKCPKNVFKNGKVANITNCDLCRSCQEYSENSIKVDGEDTKYIFTLESWGQLTGKEVFAQATKIIQKKLSDIKLK
jgi:DNA-directed RNA polymerase subunit D